MNLPNAVPKSEQGKSPLGRWQRNRRRFWRRRRSKLRRAWLTRTARRYDAE